MTKVLAIVMMLMLSGCASTLGAIGALSSATTPKVAASLQVGDKQTQVTGTTIGTTESSTQKATVKAITSGKKAEVDQSTKKTDKKTEIGEVAGSVTVNQGADTMTIILLSMGWPLLILLLLFMLWRRVRNVTNERRETAESDAGTEGSPEVLDPKVLRSVWMAEGVHNGESPQLAAPSDDGQPLR